MKRWGLYAVGLGLVFGAIVGSFFGETGMGAAYGLILGSIIFGLSLKKR